MNDTICHDVPSPGLWNRMSPLVALFLLCLLATAHSASAQGEAGIKWVEGPATVSLGNLGTMTIPVGYRFTDAEGARRFSELTHNPSGGTEIGVLIPPVSQSSTSDFWFILFRYDNT
jgi:uncharacterized membrane-anchored protein